MRILKYLIPAGLALVLTFGLYSWHQAEITKAVKAATELLDLEYRVTLEEQRKRLVERSRASEEVLLKQLQEQQRKQKDEIANIQSKSNRIIARLRDEPKVISCTGSTSGNDSGTSEGSPTELSFDMRLHAFSGEHLVQWFAEPAARMQSELKSCLVDYETVRKNLQQFKDNQK